MALCLQQDEESQVNEKTDELIGDLDTNVGNWKEDVLNLMEE